jgi:hypothetical protein
MELLRKQEEALARGPSSSSRSSHNSRVARPRNSRSRSPVRRTGYNRRRSRSPEPRRQSFRASANSGTKEGKLSVCPICLGRDPHKVSSCQAAKLWSGEKAQSTRVAGGRILNKQGVVLCSDWQKPVRCTDVSGTHRHECSGCGARDHGANGCDKAQT